MATRTQRRHPKWEDQLGQINLDPRTKREVVKLINQMLVAYDASATKRFSPAAHWLWPIRMLGALVRDFFKVFAGLGVYLWRVLLGKPGMIEEKKDAATET